MTATCDLDLRKHKLVPAEWKIAGELRDVLKIYKDATLFFSRGTPNLATVIPAMDHIDKVLATSSENPNQFSLAIHAALAIGKIAMKKYYNKTDHSEVYCIAMVLHPHHKVEYFKKYNWDPAWIETARQMVHEEFDRAYASDDIEADESGTQVDNNEVTSSKSKNIFDDLPDLAPTSSDLHDKLDRYLATNVEDVKDGLLWWFERRATFPHLSHMARDYLSILATTVSVERVFSQGHLVLPHIRNHLTGQTTRALMCVGGWSVLGLVKDVDIKAALGDEVEGPEEELSAGWDVILGCQ